MIFAVEVGQPDEVPEIEIIPLYEPVPRETDLPTPTTVPLREPETVPEHEPART